MASSSIAVDIVRLWAPDNLRKAAPGIALCAAIAAVAFVADLQGWLRFGRILVPPLIVTLAIGMALQPLSSRNALKPGIEFSGRTLLRVGVALYGARLTLGQLVEGGALPVVIALAAVGCTIVFGAVASRWRTVIAGLALMVASGLGGALAASGAQLFVSRFLEGLGFLPVVVAAPSLIAAATSGRERGMALGFFAAYMPVGVSIMILAAPAALYLDGWRLLWAAVASPVEHDRKRSLADGRMFCALRRAALCPYHLDADLYDRGARRGSGCGLGADRTDRRRQWHLQLLWRLAGAARRPRR